MGKKRKQLSQAELWDDSALLDSWDEALAEYKLYHSSHARGERVEDVIRAAETDAQDVAMPKNPPGQAALSSQTNVAISDNLEDGELEEEPESAVTFNSGYSNGETHESQTFQPEQVQHPSELAEAGTTQEKQGNAAIPNAIMNGVKDEALKNLMMSWYYTGYYTGLYEGQQQAQDTSSK